MVRCMHPKDRTHCHSGGYHTHGRQGPTLRGPSPEPIGQRAPAGPKQASRRSQTPQKREGRRQHQGAGPASPHPPPPIAARQPPKSQRSQRGLPPWSARAHDGSRCVCGGALQRGARAQAGDRPTAPPPTPQTAGKPQSSQEGGREGRGAGRGTREDGEAAAGEARGGGRRGPPPTPPRKPGLARGANHPLPHATGDARRAAAPEQKRQDGWTLTTHTGDPETTQLPRLSRKA